MQYETVLVETWKQILWCVKIKTELEKKKSFCSVSASNLLSHLILLLF